MKKVSDDLELKQGVITAAVIITVAALAMALVNSRSADEIAAASEVAVRSESALGSVTAMRNAVVQAQVAGALDGITGSRLTDQILEEARAIMAESIRRIETLPAASDVIDEFEQFNRSASRALSLVETGATARAARVISDEMEGAFSDVIEELATHRDEALEVVAEVESEAGRVMRAAQFLLVFVGPFAGVVTYRVLARREEERRELRRRIEIQNHRIESHDEAISHLSHELRTPLTAVNGLSLLMMDEVVPVEMYPALCADIAAESHVLQRRLDDLLLVARHQSTGVEFEITPVEATDLVARTVDDLIRFSHKVIRLDVEASLIRVDERWTSQMLENIIVNALEHGGDETWIVGRNLDDRRYRLAVSDNGSGVPDGVGRQLFEPYVHHDGDALSKHSLGMGLAAAKIIADGTDVTLGYERTSHTQFGLTFPRAHDIRIAADVGMPTRPLHAVLGP